MKKNLNKTISIFLTLILICSNLFTIMVSASNESDPTTCLEDHFSNLNMSNGAFLPENSYSCSYIAMSMLLSYYDTYWNERFVDEDLEWTKGTFASSTETLSSTFSATDEYQEYLTWRSLNPSGTFDEFRVEYQYNYLDLNLMSIGKILGYHDNSTDEYGLNGNRIVNILESYLYDTRGFSEDDVTVHILRAADPTVSQDEFKEAISAQIEKGFPVIYAATSVDLSNIDFTDVNYGATLDDAVGGHAMIAYSLTDNNNDGVKETINLHNGWNSSNDRVYSTLNDTEYKYWKIAIWLEINEDSVPHICSDNYEDVDQDSDVCACNVYYKTHPSHVHFHYDSYNSLNHFGECICGNITQSAVHNLFYLNITSATHRAKCNGCNYDVNINHQYTYTVDTSEHSGICACGYATGLQAHYDYRYVKMNSIKHTVYCECGYLLRMEQHTIVEDSTRYSHCLECGAVFDRFSDVTIKGEIEDDVEER